MIANSENNVDMPIRGFTILVCHSNTTFEPLIFGVFHYADIARAQCTIINKRLAGSGFTAITKPIYGKTSGNSVAAFVRSRLTTIFGR